MVDTMTVVCCVKATREVGAEGRTADEARASDLPEGWTADEAPEHGEPPAKAGSVTWVEPVSAF